MKEYQKIESIYRFDNNIKKFVKEYYNPIVEYLKDNKWVGTEKIDGTNIRIFWNGKGFEFGGRTEQAEIPKAITKILENIFNYEMEIVFEQKFGDKEVYLFCEGYGGKIQGKIYDCEESIIGFDIMIDNIYLDKEVSKSIFKELNIEFVEQIKFNNLEEAIEYVKNTEKSIKYPNNSLEGLVVYPIKRIYDHMGNRIIVKIKRKDLNKLKVK
jgi:hypothetical protein